MEPRRLCAEYPAAADGTLPLGDTIVVADGIFARPSDLGKLVARIHLDARDRLGSYIVAGSSRLHHHGAPGRALHERLQLFPDLDRLAQRVRALDFEATSIGQVLRVVDRGVELALEPVTTLTRKDLPT